jgi:hypothetical protein
MTDLVSLFFIGLSTLLLSKHKIASFRKHYRCTSYIKECSPLCPVRATTIKKRETITQNAMKKTCFAKRTARQGNLRTRRKRIIYKNSAVLRCRTAFIFIPSETSPSPHAVHRLAALTSLLSPPFFQTLSAVRPSKRQFLRCRPPTVRRRR